MNTNINTGFPKNQSMTGGKPIKRQMKKTRLKPNKEDDPCSCCGKERGTEPIYDNKDNEYWICSRCDRTKFDWD